MLIGLFTLAYILFFGGHDTFLLDPNLKKNVNTFVKDEHRRKEIDSLIKYTEKSEEGFQKKTKKVYEKKLDELNMNRNTTKDEFKKEYDLYYADFTALQNEYINSELKIRSLILPDEWQKIMDKVLVTPEKEKVKKDLLKDNKKLHDRLLKVCEKHIPDAAGKEKAKKIVDEYESKGNELAEAFLDLNYKNQDAIRPYGAKRSDFEALRKSMMDLRRNYADYLVDMRFNLMAIAPEKEWNVLAKELKENFNYMGPGISK